MTSLALYVPRRAAILADQERRIRAEMARLEQQLAEVAESRRRLPEVLRAMEGRL